MDSVLRLKQSIFNDRKKSIYKEYFLPQMFIALEKWLPAGKNQFDKSINVLKYYEWKETF